jgi:hypothetical protein
VVGDGGATVMLRRRCSVFSMKLSPRSFAWWTDRRETAARGRKQTRVLWRWGKRRRDREWLRGGWSSGEEDHAHLLLCPRKRQDGSWCVVDSVWLYCCRDFFLLFFRIASSIFSISCWILVQKRRGWKEGFWKRFVFIVKQFCKA